MESPVRTLVLLIDNGGEGTLMENDRVIREDIPDYELEAFINGL